MKKLLPVISDMILYSVIEFMDPENGELVVGTALLSSMEADILLPPV